MSLSMVFVVRLVLLEDIGHLEVLSVRVRYW